MNKKNNLIIKNSFILYIRLFVISITGLLASRYILQVLGASDFGLFNVVGGLVFIMAFLNDVMVTTTFRFISYDLGIGIISNINKTFNLSLIIHIGIAILTLILGETIGVYLVKNYLTIEPSKLVDAVFIFRVTILSTVLTILQVPFRGLLIAKEKFNLTSIIEIIRSILRLIAVLLLFLYDGNKLQFFSILTALIAFISFCHYFIYCYMRYSTIIKWKFYRGFSNYKKMLSFSFWTMFGAGASIGEIQGSSLIINNFHGTVLNASFAIATQVNNLIKTFAQNINKAVIPQITTSYSSGDSKRTMQLVIYSSKYSYFFMLIVALPILLETDYLLKIWLTEVPNYTIIFVQIMIINALISTTSAGIPPLIQATGNIKYFQLILSVLKISGLPISFLLLKRGFEPYSVLLTYTLISLLSNVIMQILLKILINFDIKYFLHKVYLRITYLTLMLFPLFFISNFFDQGLGRLFFISSISVIWLLILVYFIGIDKAEKEIFNYHFITNMKKLKSKISLL